jgi:hypothetical protein
MIICPKCPRARRKFLFHFLSSLFLWDFPTRARGHFGQFLCQPPALCKAGWYEMLRLREEVSITRLGDKVVAM